MGRSRRLLRAVLFFLVAGLLTGLLPLRDFLRPPGQEPATDLSARPETFAMKNVRLSQATSEGDRWLVVADRLAFSGPEWIVEMMPVHAVLSGKRGKEVIIEALTGRYEGKTGIMTLAEEVQVHTGGYNVRSPALQFGGRTNTITTDSEVEVGGARVSIRGRGLTYHLKTERLAIKGPLSFKSW